MSRERAQSVNKMVYAKKTARALRAALNSKRIRFFMAKRFTGKMETCSQIALLDAFHGILKPSYLRYCVRFAKIERNKLRAYDYASANGVGREVVIDSERVENLQLVDATHIVAKVFESCVSGGAHWVTPQPPNYVCL